MPILSTNTRNHVNAPCKGTATRVLCHLSSNHPFVPIPAPSREYLHEMAGMAADLRLEQSLAEAMAAYLSEEQTARILEAAFARAAANRNITGATLAGTPARPEALGSPRSAT